MFYVSVLSTSGTIAGFASRNEIVQVVESWCVGWPSVFFY